MATIESRASHGGVPRPGDGEPPSGDTGRSRSRWSWHRWTLLALGALVTAAVVTLALLAWTYQPVQFGGDSGGAFPGLPAGTAGPTDSGDALSPTYIPPQRGVFTLTESIKNNGPHTVTILAVSILSPQEQDSGIAPWPLIPAGTAHWMTPEYVSLKQHVPSTTGSFATSLSLAPGDFIIIGIPLRMSGSCYDPHELTGGDTIYVQERFGFFTHWVAVTVTPAWTLHPRFDPTSAQASASGSPQGPANTLICPAK